MHALWGCISCSKMSINHSQPLTTPLGITTFVLPQTLLPAIPSLTKVPEATCFIKGTVSRVKTQASWSLDVENILE